uniref:Uncharacterized protein n=1 Tax=Rhizophora mucronata TaxID=61149 RepID=A0A2P2NSI3_RHIMU
MLFLAPHSTMVQFVLFSSFSKQNFLEEFGEMQLLHSCPNQTVRAGMDIFQERAGPQIDLETVMSVSF